MKHIPVLLVIMLVLAADYEIRFAAESISENGLFKHDDVTVRHPEQTIMHSEGSWGGAVSSRQDTDGNHRLVMGFNGVFFEESDGSEGGLVGTFLGLSEAFKEAGVARPIPVVGG